MSDLNNYVYYIQKRSLHIYNHVATKHVCVLFLAASGIFLLIPQSFMVTRLAFVVCALGFALLGMAEQQFSNKPWECKWDDSAFRDDVHGCQGHNAMHKDRYRANRLEAWNNLLFNFVPEKDAGFMRYLAKVEKAPTPTAKSPKLSYCIGVNIFIFKI